MSRTLILAVSLAAAVFTMNAVRAQSDAAAADSIENAPITLGSRVIRESSRYSKDWAAFYLMDGSVKVGWCSAEGAPLPHELVFELAEPAFIEEAAVVNAADESGYPGISVKRLRLESSTEGPEGPWKQLGEFELAPGPEALQPLEFDSVEARWIRATVLENHGHASYSEFMELALTGSYASPEREPVDITGTWSTSWHRSSVLGGATAYLKREGDRVYGTYEHREGRLAGGFDGRVMSFTWVQNTGRGLVTLALNAEGDAMHGFWWDEGRLVPQGWWRFEKQDAAAVEVEDDYLEKEIAGRGKVSIYGINFPLDSDEIREESVPSLERLVKLMNDNPGWALSVVGHTDSQGSNDYNLDLSKRRAAAVVAWLTAEGGIESGRLRSEGRGEVEPVASNDEPLGRAANRRVELVRI